MKGIRTVLFWAIRPQVVVIPYQQFRTTYWSQLQRRGSTVPSSRDKDARLPLEDRTNRLSGNIRKELPLLAV